MADDAVSRQELELRHLEQSLVEEQLSSCGPFTGVHLQTLLNKLLQIHTQSTAYKHRRPYELKVHPKLLHCHCVI